MQCPECDTDLEAGARFCPRCGAPADDPDRTDAHAPVSAGWPSDADEGPSHSPQDLETSVIATPPAEESASRECPSCGAPNSPRRELCGRCGADLETGVTPPYAAGDEQPTSSRRAGAAGSERRGLNAWFVVLGALAVVVVVVVGLSVAGLGPFAGTPSLPEADFPTDVYGDESEVLVLSDIATSSALEPSGGERYDATQMVDDDPTTAWNSDGSQAEDGVGETIDLFLADPVWVERLVFNNGFQRDAETYADNARIRRADVLLDGGERLSIRLEDLGLQRQAIELPEPLLTTTVRIEVTETFPGDSYPDLAVSDIALEGWLARGEDVEVAQERAERARAAPPTR